MVILVRMDLKMSPGPALCLAPPPPALREHHAAFVCLCETLSKLGAIAARVYVLPSNADQIASVSRAGLTHI